MLTAASSSNAVAPSDTSSGTFIVSSGEAPATKLPHTPKALLSPPVRPADTQPGEDSNDSAEAAVADLEKLCDRLVVTNFDDDDDVEASPTALRMDWLAPRGSAGGKSSAASSANATGGLTGVVGGAEPAPPPGGFFHLVINPDPALLPTFKSTKSVEDILLDQARYGPYVRAASYEQVNKTFLAQRPAGLPLTAPPWGRHNDASNPGQAATQVFIGQLPSFASEEWLTMCLEFVYGAPGSVHYTVVRRESTGTQAGYALATLGDASLVPVFINLSRHIFFGKKNVFYTDPAQNHVNEFQRIIARVMAIDATRPHPEVSSIGYARACLVIATANPPSRSPTAANAGPSGRGRGGGGAGRGGRLHGLGGMGAAPPPAYTPGAGTSQPNLSPPPPPPFAAAFAGSAALPTTPPASGPDNVWGAPPLLSPKDIAAAQRGNNSGSNAFTQATNGQHTGHHQRVPQPRHAPAPRSTGLPGYDSHRPGNGNAAGAQGNYRQSSKHNHAPPQFHTTHQQQQQHHTASNGHHHGGLHQWASQPPMYQQQQQQHHHHHHQTHNATASGNGQQQHFQQAHYQPQQQPQQQPYQPQMQQHHQHQAYGQQQQHQQLYTMSSSGEYVPVPMTSSHQPPMPSPQHQQQQGQMNSWAAPAPVTVVSPPTSAGSLHASAWTPPPSA